MPVALQVTSRLHLLVAALAVVFLAGHLAYLPPALENIDSVNFALGVESFDVSRHQPHPPGYPVFVGLTKASTRVVAALASGWDRDRRAAVGLALPGIIAGALAAFVLLRFWTAAGLPSNLAGCAALLTLVSPLFWITAARPLSDTVGFVSALVVQVWWLDGWRRFRDGAAALPRTWLLAAFGAGLIIGIRSQTMWLTGPLACWAVGELAWRRRWMQAGILCALAIIGVLAWAGPLIWLSGGLDAYMRILGAQGAEDFVGVEMLATVPTLDMLQLALARTFILPWHYPALGRMLALLALVGMARLAWRSPRVLAVIGLAYWPYLVFHLTFHETETMRYALPMLAPMAGLAVVGLAGAGRVATAVGVVVATAASIVAAQPQLRAYAAEASPTAHVFRDMIATRRAANTDPRFLMHHQTWWAFRRTTDWYRPEWNVGPQPFPGDREWLHVVDHFRAGRDEPVWFLTDLPRSDVALFDRRTRELKGRYERPAGLQRLVGGDWLEAAAWWEIRRPGWMLGRGWALTPEIAGATSKDRREPQRQPAEAWLRREAGQHRLMIGGRYLGGSGDAALILTLDGREIARWTITPSQFWFVHWLDLPSDALTGDGPYAALTARVESADGRGDAPELGLEQFDFAPADSLMYALTEGWHELEENPQTGLQWRWSSDSSRIVVYGATRDARVRVAGESPLVYFDQSPTVRIIAGGLEAGSFSPAGDFDETVLVRGARPAEAPLEIAITTDRIFVPGDLNGGADRRRLGLRLYRVEISTD